MDKKLFNLQYSRKVIYTLLIILSFIYPFYSQEDTVSKTDDNFTEENKTSNISKENTKDNLNENLNTLFNSLEDNNGNTTINRTNPDTTTGGRRPLNTFFSILRIVIILILIVACIYGVMWFMKKSMKLDTPNEDPFLRKIASINLAVGKTAQIITLIDKAYILGVSDNSVNLIAEIKDSELINAMNLYADENQSTKKPRTFSDILNIFMPGGPKNEKDKDVFNSSRQKLNELLKKQKDRVNNISNLDENATSNE